MDPRLRTELWTSWASVLRSYAAMHGMNSTHHAVVEISAKSILLRVDTRWLQFTDTVMQSSDGLGSSFALNEDGSVTLGPERDEMDFAAERLTRSLFLPDETLRS